MSMPVKVLWYRCGWMAGANGERRKPTVPPKDMTSLGCRTPEYRKTWRRGYDDATRLRLAMFAYSAAEYRRPDDAIGGKDGA